ncbi:hypothetical protein PRZ48_012035 [Zasmidium cellare]|uniref:Helicase ATP-binding domain-containing protein n=1 Tax=Zasmidium cellare TaxID=395010 RepID=A0ABR0E828_ZASCE|nr:hypothetical protein PRZ48_012035 [Zasmidium cellare]
MPPNNPPRRANNGDRLTTHRGGRKSGAVDKVGIHTGPGIDGVTYPNSSQECFARAFCLSENAGVIRLAQAACRARPEFVDARLHATQTSNGIFEKCMEALTTDNEEARDLLNRDQLETEEYRELTGDFINARMITFLRKQLEANIAERTERNIGEQDFRTDIPVPMNTYRTPENDRLHKLLFKFINWIAKMLTGNNPFRQGGPEEGGIRQAAQDYRSTHLEADHAPAPPLPQRLLLHLTRNHQERYVTLDHPEQLTFEGLCAIVSARFNFRGDQDILKKMVLHTEDGERVVLDAASGMDDIYEQTTQTIDIAIDHVHMAPASGPDDPNHPAFYPASDASIGSFPSQGGKREVSADRMREMISWVREWGRSDRVEGPQVPDSTRVAGEEGRAAEERMEKMPDRRAAMLELKEEDELTQVQEMTQQEFDELRGGSAQSNPRYSNMNTVKNTLRHLIPGCSVLDSWAMPTQTNGQAGKTLTPGQLTGLVWTLDKETERGGGIIADAPGMGKTLMMASNIYASNHRHENTTTPVTAPTMVAVPAGLVQKTCDELSLVLGRNYRVFRYGFKKQPASLTNEVFRVELDPQNRAFQPFRGSTVANHVIVISYEALSSLWDEIDPEVLRGLFARIICDECHAIRFFEMTKRGQLIKAIQARFRFGYSGTPLYNSLLDMGGYVAFLQQPHFTEAHDKNTDEGAIRRLDYMEAVRWSDEWVKRMQEEEADLPDVSDVKNAPNVPQNFREWRPHPKLYEEKDSIPATEREDLLGKCNDWPAKALMWNRVDAQGRRRRPSIDPDRRSATTKTPKHLKIADVEFAAPNLEGASDAAPFGGEPVFEMHHAQNYNKLQCATTQAWNFWIAPHLEKWRREGDKQSLQKAMSRTAILFDDMVLSRDHTSFYTDENDAKVAFTRNMAPMKVQRVRLQFGDGEMPYYRKANLDAEKEVDFDLKDSSAKITMGDAYPEMFLTTTDKDLENAEAKPQKELGKAKRPQKLRICTHPAFRKWRFLDADDWEERRKLSLAYMVWEMKRTQACGLQDMPDPFSSEKELLRQALACSPKFRQMLVEAYDTVSKTPDDGKKNVIVYTDFGSEAILAQKYLDFCGFDTILLTSKESPDERYETLKKSFNAATKPKVLIMPLTLRLAGLNLHHRCCRVICLGQSNNMATLIQAIHRVHRLDQTVAQLVTRYYLSNTYMVEVEQKMIDKAASINTVTAADTRAMIKLPGDGDHSESATRDGRALAYYEAGAKAFMDA